MYSVAFLFSFCTLWLITLKSTYCCWWWWWWWAWWWWAWWWFWGWRCWMILNWLPYLKIKYFLYSFNEKEKKNLSIILQSIIECHSSNTEIWFKPFLVIDFCAIHDFGTCFKTSFCPLCYVLRQMFNKYIIVNVVFSWHMLILTLKYALWYFYSWIQNTL